MQAVSSNVEIKRRCGANNGTPAYCCFLLPAEIVIAFVVVVVVVVVVFVVVLYFLIIMFRPIRCDL